MSMGIDGTKNFPLPPFPLNSVPMGKLFCILAAVLSVSAGTQAGETANIDVSAKRQQIEGWGASLCWWASELGKWDEAIINEVVDFVTSPDKLNMNLFRYNIGGGDDPTHIGGHMLSENGGKGKRAEMEGFKDDPNAPYDWSRDAGQRKVMLKIREARPDAIFEAFSNSPPYWMTHSGCAAGNFNGSDDNLKPEYYEAFCDYLIEVCRHYKDAYGLEFATLEPFNEPASPNVWSYKGSQEGCHFDADTQIKIIRLLHEKLKKSGLKTGISASDETCVRFAIDTFKAYDDAGDILEKLAQFNVHTYDGSRAEKIELGGMAKAKNIRFWQSESGPLGMGGYPLKVNLLQAGRMFEDLIYMRPTAWLDWQVIDTSETWSFFRGRFHPESEYGGPNKNLYVRMQVTRFFKRGFFIVQSGNDNCLAAVSPGGKTLAIAVVNTEDNDVEFSLNGIPKSKKISAWRTSKEENCSEIKPPEAKGGTVNYTAPALSIATFVLELE